MSKKPLAICVRGRTKEWSFMFRGDPKYLDVWRADGLLVGEVVDRIPTLVVDLGLARAWSWFQDAIAKDRTE